MNIKAAVLALALLAPEPAHAFCGFYVSGADAKLFNNATLVVMMREGTRTVLSMQNSYQGPPESFAMVVPVPVVLQKENVKTLPREIFDKVDKLTAPRLVEYWEMDPCAPQYEYKHALGGAIPPPMAVPQSAAPGNYGVKIEAQFTVGEYEVVILSAQDAAGLDRWLKDNKYKIPEGAEPYLRPYVQSGSKFFVAKVDTKKVTFDSADKTSAMLSPLRFHYDSDQFNLPIRLGLINSSGTQDLIVNILAKGQRYEVANYKNVTIPTNLDLDSQAKEKFPGFYAALFDKTLEQNAGSVVTEYSWDASSCDPCPTPSLDFNELATLGADVLPGAPPPPSPKGGAPPPMMWRPPLGFVITRLHARYNKAALGEDLVFRAAPPIQGGREVRNANNQLEKGSTPGGGINNFQGRYAIRHPWTGKIECQNPVRGRWGGPPGQGTPPPAPAARIQLAPRGGIQLAAMVKEDVPEIGLKMSGASDVPAPQPTTTPTTPATSTPPAPKSGGCAGCATTPAGASALGALAALLSLVFFARRRSS